MLSITLYRWPYTSTTIDNSFSFRSRHMALSSLRIRLKRYHLRSIFLFVSLLVSLFIFCALHNFRYPISPLQTLPPSYFQKELIVSSTKADDTSWLHEHLPLWKANIYIADDHLAALTVPKNKGLEAMVYLTYIIDHYNHLPDIMVFIHSQRYQWHNDDPLYDGLPLLQSLQIPYVLSTGYVNLRCAWTLGCPSEIQLHRVIDEKLPSESAYPRAFQQLFPNQPLPDVVGVGCCAQFAVTRTQVHLRPLGDYERYREWLLHTELDDETSGRVMEYMWHIIFRRPAVHCPYAAACYCKTYGLCDLKCTTGECGRWPFPPYSSLPEGWPRFGWNGEERSDEFLAQWRKSSTGPI